MTSEPNTTPTGTTRMLVVTFLSRVTAQVAGALVTLLFGLSLAGSIGATTSKGSVHTGAAQPAWGTDPSFLILPLDQPGDGPCAGFGSMLAEGVAADLAGSGKLRVVSSTSSKAYKASRRAVPDFGGQAGSDFVLEGAVQCDQGRIRITVRLIDAARDYPVWTETYDSNHTRILSTHDELKATIALAIREVVGMNGTPVYSRDTSSK